MELNNDSTIYKMPVELVNVGDTTYVDMQAKDVKELYVEIFGKTAKEMLLSKDNIQNQILLITSYSSILLFILIFIPLVNIKWNKTFDRVSEIWKKINQTEDRNDKMLKLSLQRHKIGDRILFNLSLWGCALSMDTLLVFSNIYDFPYLSVPLLLFIVRNVIKITSSISGMNGYKDDDIADNFDKILKQMVIKPIVESITNAFSNKIMGGFKNE